MSDSHKRPDWETRKRLQAALNEILLYGIEALAPDWDIKIRMTGGLDGHGECGIELIDPDGREVSAEWDGDSLNVWDMVDHSRNPNGEDMGADD